ncbi:MAG: DnaJ domain-containing protein [Syntrophobacterales bacterium]|nr:DnaJ domain-containing protein [Syntrophobacterales bacterium]
MKDYYKILGVPRNASHESICEAYRRAAKKYHPDVVGTGDHERFLEIREAYEVLGNPERRRQYDRIREKSSQRFNKLYSKREGYSRVFRECSTVRAELILSRSEAYYGGLFTVNVPFNILCTSCNGLWWHSWYCRQCHGNGIVNMLMPITVKVPPRTIPGTVIILKCTDPWGRLVQVEFFCRIESLL